MPFDDVVMDLGSSGDRGTKWPNEEDEGGDSTKQEHIEGTNSNNSRGTAHSIPPTGPTESVARFTSTNAHGLATMENDILEMFLIPSSHWLARAGLAANKDYTDAAAGLQSLSLGSASVDLVSFGPPFVTIFYQVMNAARMAAHDELAITPMDRFWNDHVAGKTADEILNYLTHFSIHVPNSQRLNDVVAVQYQITVTHPAGATLKQILGQVFAEANAMIVTNIHSLATMEKDVLEMFLVPSSHWLARAGLAANKDYTDAAAGLQELSLGDDSVDLVSFGPPFVTIFYLVMNAARMAAHDELAVFPMERFWNDHVAGKTADEIMSYLTHFSAHVPSSQCWKDMVAVQYQITVTHPAGATLKQILGQVFIEADALSVADAARGLRSRGIAGPVVDM